jgi:Cu/Ag efflux protein CusF
MTRMFVLVAAALFVLAGLVVADDAKPEKKKGSAVAGVVKKIDASVGSITLTIKNKKMPDGMDKEFKIGASVKFVLIDGDAKTELAAKDGLKSEKLKEGASVRIETNDKGEATIVTVGERKKKKDK